MKQICVRRRFRTQFFKPNYVWNFQTLDSHTRETELCEHINRDRYKALFIIIDWGNTNSWQTARINKAISNIGSKTLRQNQIKLLLPLNWFNEREAIKLFSPKTAKCFFGICQFSITMPFTNNKKFACVSKPSRLRIDGNIFACQSIILCRRFRKA